MSKGISVTEIRNALRCPRLFTLGRLRKRQVGFPVGTSSLGATFHRIVDDFGRRAEALAPRIHDGASPQTPAGSASGPAIGQRAEARASGATGQEAGEVVRDALMGGLAREFEQNPALASMPAEVDDLAEALRRFGDFVTETIRAANPSPGEALGRLFRHTELGVDAVVPAGNGESVRVTGRIDALFAGAGGELEVVEYKLTDEANDELDRAQVALYRFLLREHRDIDARPMLLRFTPELQVTRLEPREADALVDGTVLPLVARMVAWLEHTAEAPATARPELCPSCPVRDDCVRTYREHLPGRDDPPAGAARPRIGSEGPLPGASPGVPAPATPDDGAPLEAERVQRALERAFVELGVRMRVQGAPCVGPSLIVLEVSASKRGSVKSLDNHAEDAIHRLHADHQLTASYEKENGRRRFWVARKEPRPVHLGALLDRERAFLAERAGRYVLGETVDGNVLKGDFADPTACHLLVGGTSGSGKSVLLKGIAASLVQHHPPSRVRLTLIDPKRVTFGSMRASLGPHLAQPLCHDAEQALAILEGLVDEMESRYHLFEVGGVENIDDYNAIATEDLPRHVVIVDEFADLLADKATRKPFETTLQRLGQKARAAGIHLVLATQRPDRETVPPILKANLPGRIALRVQSGVNSRIVLDCTGAEALLGKGDLLANLGNSVVRAQAALV